jgi:hypothetical protein
MVGPSACRPDAKAVRGLPATHSRITQVSGGIGLNRGSAGICLPTRIEGGQAARSTVPPFGRSGRTWTSGSDDLGLEHGTPPWPASFPIWVSSRLVPTNAKAVQSSELLILGLSDWAMQLVGDVDDVSVGIADSEPTKAPLR